MTECPCSKLVELVQRLLRDTETCVAAVPSLMPPSDIRAVLCVVRSTLGEPALFLYSLSPGTRGLALRDVLPLSTHALTLTATASSTAGTSTGGSSRNTAVTVVVQRRKDGAKLVFETLVTPDADRRTQLATFAGMAETAARDIVVTEDTFGWVLRYKLSLLTTPLLPLFPPLHAHSQTRITRKHTSTQFNWRSPNRKLQPRRTQPPQLQETQGNQAFPWQHPQQPLQRRRKARKRGGAGPGERGSGQRQRR